MQVSAANLDALDGGVGGQVVSSLIGVQRNTIVEEVQATVANADLKLAGLQVYALNASSLGANAKVASNQASGFTRVLVSNSAIGSSGELRLLASDLTRVDALSDGFSANLGLLTEVSVGVAAASNVVDRSTQVRLSDSTVQASAVHLITKSAASISANAEAMALSGGALSRRFQAAVIQ